MGSSFDNESLMEFYVYETMEQLTKLENIALQSEQENSIRGQINEVFRLVHTIKGSSAVMNYKNIVEITHSLEDVFFYLREKDPQEADYSSLTDLVLKSIDNIKAEISVIQSGSDEECDSANLVNEIKRYLSVITKKEKSSMPSQEKVNLEIPFVSDSKQQPGQFQYRAVIFFEDGCEMENVRAFNMIYNLKNTADIINYIPSDILQNQETAEYIRKNGFEINFFSALNFEDVTNVLSNILFVSETNLEIISEQNNNIKSAEQNPVNTDNSSASTKPSMISVNILKMDRLMDLVGELVIAQSMVVQNPDLEGLSLGNFQKASRQLQLVTNDIQDAVMSLRMVSLTMTFQRMNRIVRDMSKKLNKEIRLEVIGENTEVDKNIIEHLSDPLLHLVRNCADHGIEDSDTRKRAGKPEVGTITLEAKNDGGDVRINVKDDGKGLDKNKILQKAKQLGLLKKPENEYTEKEIYNMIFLPGFSTKEQITEYSGRGVGMDVVNKNMEEIGGMVQIDSSLGNYTSIMLKIPLTLAIVDGMKIRVGKTVYIVPITAIKESFRITDQNIIHDEAQQTEMIMIRGGCYPVLRLHRYFKVPTKITKLEDGIIMMVENETKSLCLFADELLGVQQVVIKALPDYINNRKGISSCTVVGNGNVSLIIDVPDLLENV